MSLVAKTDTNNPDCSCPGHDIPQSGIVKHVKACCDILHYKESVPWAVKNDDGEWVYSKCPVHPHWKMKGEPRSKDPNCMCYKLWLLKRQTEGVTIREDWHN